MTTEIISRLNKLNTDCIIVDDMKINRIEALVLVRDKKSFLSLMANEGLSLSFEEDGIERRLIILSFGDIGIKSYAEKWFDRAEDIPCASEGVNHIFKLADDDIRKFYLLYVFTYEKNNSWVRRSVIDYLLKSYSVDREEMLAQILADRINSGELKLSFASAFKLSYILKNYVTGANRYKLSFVVFIRKIQNRIPLAVLTIKSVFHRKVRYLPFIKKINANPSVKGKLTIIGKYNGSSSSVLLREDDGENVFFIKGNELPVYHSFDNEVDSQDRIRSAGLSDRFISMVSCDRIGHWIKYPFVKYGTLDDYCKSHGALTESECELLGEYLINLIEDLRQLQIKHNDLRPSNIMVKRNDDGKAAAFYLSDFGCACVDGRYPWQEKTGWGSYFAKHVGGDYRYSRTIIDDAAAAGLVYRYAGGCAETVISKLNDSIGKYYFVSE